MTDVLENAEKKENSIDLNVLKIFQKFGGSNPDTNKVWFGSDMIVSTEPKKKGLMYIPKHRMFSEEFGTTNLRSLLSLFSLLDKVEIEFDLPDIIFYDKEAGSMVNYRSASQTSFEEKRKSIDAIKGLRAVSVKKIDDGEFFRFKLTKEVLSKINIAGNTIGQASTKGSILSIIKEEGDDTIVLNVSNDENANTYNKTIKDCDNSGNLGNFSHDILVNRLLDCGEDWDVYIFDGKIEHLGKTIPVVWTYMTTGNFDMITLYNKKKKK